MLSHALFLLYKLNKQFKGSIYHSKKVICLNIVVVSPQVWSNRLLSLPVVLGRAKKRDRFVQTHSTHSTVKQTWTEHWDAEFSHNLIFNYIIIIINYLNEVTITQKTWIV